MQTLQEYKCPCCGGAIAFDSTLQKMKCPFCGTEFEMDALKSYDAELQGEQADNMEWETSAGSEWQESEIEVVMMNQFAGLLKPDIVIPFKLDKKAAKAGLMKHLNGKKLLPKIFKDQNHIDEVKGVYVPFWLFDTDVDAQVRYRATKVRTWSDEDYRYTETSYYMIHRGGSVGFEHVPVDGSSKMPDDLMESVEPYDYSDALDFQTAYLAGYFADKYDVTAEESINRANQRVRRSTEDAFASTVQGYATVNAESSSVQFHGGKAKYALYPVWLLNTTWNGEKYTFAMNGQTGKLVGDLPVDKLPPAALRGFCILQEYCKGGITMKKRILAMIFVLALCFCTVIPAFAVDADGFVSEYERVQDMAKLLSESEREALIKTLDELSERQKMDVIVVTTNTLDGKKPMEYADDIYDYCKYGYGEKRDGLLFLVSMEDRDWWISTCGYGITAFTDAGIQYIGEQMVEDLGDGNYAAAFNTFAELSDDFITKSREGEPYDKSNLPKGPLSIVWIVISILVGIGLAMFIVGRMKAQLKTVRFQAAAGDYMKSGSLNITESRDTFLYNTVTRTAKPKNTDSGSSGGSSTHTSSSGETHGGGGGKF